MEPTPVYPTRRSTRLRGYDYAQAGAYFVTLCVAGRLSLLGQVTAGEIHLSPAGTMVAEVWSGLDRHYPVGVDAFVVMPTHVHGILVLGEDCDGDGLRHGSTAPAPSLSLSTLVQRFKTFTQHEYGRGVASQGWPRYSGRLWQQRFYDHVVRSERDLAAIREYIANNPLQWQLDRENPERLG
jgi:REP element-mobilizing transposase RayT